MSFKRTSTQKHTFGIPYDYEENVEAFVITYSQKDKPILEFTEDDIGLSVTVKGSTIIVSLSQEDTAKFEPGEVIGEIKLWTKDGKSNISEDIPMYVRQVRNERIFV
jgi:hypothetical protein